MNIVGRLRSVVPHFNRLKAALFAFPLLVLGSSVAQAKQCTPDEILTLAKQGFSKADIGKVCENASDAASSSKLSALIKAFVIVAKSGASNIGQELTNQGSWGFAKNPSGKFPPFLSQIDDWQVYGVEDQIQISQTFAPQSPDVSSRCQELKSAFSAIAPKMQAPLTKDISSFSDGGFIVDFGGKSNNGMLDNRISVLISCRNGGFRRQSNGQIQQAAYVGLQMMRK